MSQNASGDNLLLGKGKVYFDRFSTGTTRTGERFLGNCSSFELSAPEDEKKEMYSSCEATAGLLKSVTIRRKMKLSIKGHEFTKENLALALMGDNSALSQGTASITNEAVTAIAQGCYYKLAYRNISAVTINPAAGGDAYVVTTDYVVDAVSGRIYIVPGGGIAAGTAIHVDYTYSADTSPTIRGGVSSLIEGFVRFIGAPTEGPTEEVEVWRASVTPQGALGLISDEYGEFTLEMEILSDTDNHSTEPYFRIIQRSA